MLQPVTVLYVDDEHDDDPGWSEGAGEYFWATGSLYKMAHPSILLSIIAHWEKESVFDWSVRKGEFYEKEDTNSWMKHKVKILENLF